MHALSTCGLNSKLQLSHNTVIEIPIGVPLYNLNLTRPEAAVKTSTEHYVYITLKNTH